MAIPDFEVDDDGDSEKQTERVVASGFFDFSGGLDGCGRPPARMGDPLLLSVQSVVLDRGRDHRSYPGGATMRKRAPACHAIPAFNRNGSAVA